MKNQWIAKCAITAGLICWGVASGAAPTFERATLWVDSTDYNGTYTVGVRAWVTGQGSGVKSVVASHQPVLGDMFRPWTLDLMPDGSYWSWASNHVWMGFGQLTGSVTLTAQDADGGITTTSDLQFRPEVEVDIPVMSVAITDTGYRVKANNIAGADYYTLWLWDPVDMKYPSSQQVADVASLGEVSFVGLVDGRTYRLFLSAYNPFTAGTLDSGNLSMFRSTTAVNLTFSATPVPEPGTAAMFLGGIGLLLRIAAKRRCMKCHMVAPSFC